MPSYTHVVGQAVERKRVLSTYPSEEITGNVLFFRKGEYFLEAVFGLVFGGDIFDCNLAHNRINFEICCKITTLLFHKMKERKIILHFRQSSLQYLRSI